MEFYPLHLFKVLFKYTGIHIYTVSFTNKNQRRKPVYCNIITLFDWIVSMSVFHFNCRGIFYLSIGQVLSTFLLARQLFYLSRTIGQALISNSACTERNLCCLFPSRLVSWILHQDTVWAVATWAPPPHNGINCGHKFLQMLCQQDLHHKLRYMIKVRIAKFKEIWFCVEELIISCLFLPVPAFRNSFQILRSCM